MENVKSHRVRLLYRELASAIEARRNCLAATPVNEFGLDIHEKTISVCGGLLPSGSGWDNGTSVDLEESHANKLVLSGGFHHMSEHGFYEGWTEHTIIVKPSLTSDFDLRITGPNRNEIKDYLAEAFDYALRQDIAYYLYAPRFPELAVQSTWEDEDGKMSQCYQAWYAGIGDNRKRFWNDPQGAMDYAADFMEQAFYAPKA